MQKYCTNIVSALYYQHMTTLTIRIDDQLKQRAFRQADKLGVPLTLIVKNALTNFIKSPQVIIGEPEIMKVTPAIQKKMDKLGKLATKIFSKE